MKKLLLIFSILLTASTVFATTFSFQNITNNNATNAATGESQLFVNVTDAGSNLVSFYFGNTGPLASSITDIYFDSGPLLSISQINNGPGVSFSQGASPPDLPGGNTVNFQATTGLLADSDAPTQPNGVNPGEWVNIITNLVAGSNFNAVLADLADGDLRIGIHVQGFANGGSESFTNNGPKPVPEPATVLLLGAGLIGVTGYSRKKFKNN